MKPKRPKTILGIGTIVEFGVQSYTHKVCDKGSTGNKIRIISTRECLQINGDKRIGIIVGAQYLHSGKVVTGTGYYSEDFTPGYFIKDKPGIFHYKVAYSYMTKPVFVHPEDLTVLVKMARTDYIPLGWNGGRFTDEFKEVLREEAKYIKRDKHGKFC